VKKGTVVNIKNPEVVDLVTQLIKDGAVRLIAEAIEIEVQTFINAVSEQLADGRPRVVRNGYLPERSIMTGVGGVNVKVPRVRDRGDGSIGFKSALIPPYMRRTATIEKVLPLLYLKGVSENDFGEVLSPIFGPSAKNLSPGVISRLKSAWEEEQLAWSKRPLSDKQYVYWWVDGIGFPARDEERRCVLVVLGVNAQGQKELIALEDGFRESTESWLDLLRNLRDRGIVPPKLVIGDGALGFWGAVTDVFPEAKHQRCWFHKMGNVLDKLPKSQQSKAKSMLQEIWMAATRKDAYAAFDAFIAEYEAKYPKATECLKKDKVPLLTFYDFPAEHWVHIRTTNPIESTFATVRNRTYKVKGAFSSKTIVMMTFKLMQSAQKRWIRLRGFHHLDNVIRGIPFKDGKLVENINDLSINEQLDQDAA
jgi:transposase-like protein